MINPANNFQKDPNAAFLEWLETPLPVKTEVVAPQPDQKSLKTPQTLRSRIATLWKMGIPVIPLQPQSKKPATLHAAYDATTDRAVIAQWVKTFSPNSNVGAVARYDGFWFLDDDRGTLAEAYKKATGQEMPHTFKVRTGRGFHYYFRHDDASRLVRYGINENSGVIETPGFKGEARCNYQYVVALGSVHPSGAIYKAASDAPPIAAPVTFLEWLKSQYTLSESLKPESEKPKSSGKSDSGFAKLFDAVGYRPLEKRINTLPDAGVHLEHPLERGDVVPCPMPQHKHNDYTPGFGSIKNAPELLHCLGNCGWSGDMVAACHQLDGGNATYKNMYDCARAICKEEGLNFEEFFSKPITVAEPIANDGTKLSDTKPTAAIGKALGMKTANSDTKPANASTVMSVYACDVVPHPIEFLWEPYLQTNALNAYYGNPGGGKGFTGMDNIACLTTGRPFPTEATTDRKAMNVVILDAEQGIDDTLVPRLKAAGADLKKVRIITTVRVHEKDDSFSERMITFQEDIAAVKADLQQHPEEKFLFVDPITNYVGDINFNQDGEVRPVLTMLVQLAEELRITVVIVGHFNKNSNVSTALDKPGGCRAWTAVPRAVWGFFRQSDNKQQRVMVNLKLNNAKEVDTGLLFTVEDQIIGTTPKGKPWVVGHIVWGEHTDATADDLVAADHPESRRDTKGVDFINDALKEGMAPATLVYERAESKHISESTLKRACANVGVLKYKMPGVGWFWQHPTDRTPIPEAARELNQEARVRREQQGASAMAIVDGKSVNEEPL